MLLIRNEAINKVPDQKAESFEIDQSKARNHASIKGREIKKRVLRHSDADQSNL